MRPLRHAGLRELLSRTWRLSVRALFWTSSIRRRTSGSSWGQQAACRSQGLASGVGTSAARCSTRILAVSHDGLFVVLPMTSDKRCAALLQRLCKACLLLEGLNKGLPRLGISKARGPPTEVEQPLDRRAGVVQANGSIAGQISDPSDTSCHDSSAVVQHPSARVHRQLAVG